MLHCLTVMYVKNTPLGLLLILGGDPQVAGKQPHVLPRNVGSGTIPYLAYSPRPHWRDVQPGIGGYVKQGLSQLNFEI